MSITTSSPWRHPHDRPPQAKLAKEAGANLESSRLRGENRDSINAWPVNPTPWLADKVHGLVSNSEQPYGTVLRRLGPSHNGRSHALLLHGAPGVWL